VADAKTGAACPIAVTPPPATLPSDASGEVQVLMSDGAFQVRVHWLHASAGARTRVYRRCMRVSLLKTPLALAVLPRELLYQRRPHIQRLAHQCRRLLRPSLHVDVYVAVMEVIVMLPLSSAVNVLRATCADGLLIPQLTAKYPNMLMQLIGTPTSIPQFVTGASGAGAQAAYDISFMVIDNPTTNATVHAMTLGAAECKWCVRVVCV
jgi:hypothetical protein